MNAEEVLLTFKKRKLTLGSVESVTAGLFGSSICSIPGASEVYLGGLITYDPKEKINLAKVDPQTIASHSVVSPEVAKEMAIGGRKVLGVDVCVSATGSAGPTVCPGGAEVGTIYLAIADKTQVKVIPLHLHGARNAIRLETVNKMIDAVVEFVSDSSVRS